jgi:hypothetical protein
MGSGLQAPDYRPELIGTAFRGLDKNSRAIMALTSSSASNRALAVMAAHVSAPEPAV